VAPNAEKILRELASVQPSSKGITKVGSGTSLLATKSKLQKEDIDPKSSPKRTTPRSTKPKMFRLSNEVEISDSESSTDESSANSAKENDPDHDFQTLQKLSYAASKSRLPSSRDNLKTRPEASPRTTAASEDNDDDHFPTAAELMKVASPRTLSKSATVALAAEPASAAPSTLLPRPVSTSTESLPKHGADVHSISASSISSKIPTSGLVSGTPARNSETQMAVPRKTMLPLPKQNVERGVSPAHSVEVVISLPASPEVQTAVTAGTSPQASEVKLTTQQSPDDAPMVEALVKHFTTVISQRQEVS
jgi:hypothetical protein